VVQDRDVRAADDPQNPQTNVTGHDDLLRGVKSARPVASISAIRRTENGVVYTADSVYVVRGGKVPAVRRKETRFSPSSRGCTISRSRPRCGRLRRTAFNLTRLYTRDWQGRRRTSRRPIGGRHDIAQFWIDKQRLIVVRMLLHLNPRRRTRWADIRLEDYRPPVVVGGKGVGCGWRSQGRDSSRTAKCGRKRCTATGEQRRSAE